MRARALLIGDDLAVGGVGRRCTRTHITIIIIIIIVIRILLQVDTNTLVHRDRRCRVVEFLECTPSDILHGRAGPRKNESALKKKRRIGS